MFHDLIFLLLGLVMVIAGGNFLTDGAVSVARRFGISSLVIGLTVVAFGSSTPDFVISLISTLQHKSDLAIGDVVGANIFDLTLVAGVTALISPIVLKKNDYGFDLPMLMLSSVVLFICGDDKIIDGAPANFINRTDGLLMLFFYGFFLWRVLKGVNMQRVLSAATGKPLPQQDVAEKPKFGRLASAGLIVGGLALLVIGGDWLVDGASGLARRLGMSEGMVGLTIVGIGSSVPDLATSAIAAIKKQPGIALGNIVGSCLFNVFFIIGFCGTVHPLKASNITFVDFGMLVLASLLLLLFGSLGRAHRIGRWQGGVLVACYAAYFIYLVTTI